MELTRARGQPYESSGAAHHPLPTHSPPPHYANNNNNNNDARAAASLRPDAAYDPYRSPAENGIPLRHYAHSQVSRTSLDSTAPVAEDQHRGDGGRDRARGLDVSDMRESTGHKVSRGTRNGCEGCCGSCLSSCLTM